MLNNISSKMTKIKEMKNVFEQDIDAVKTRNVTHIMSSIYIRGESHETSDKKPGSWLRGQVKRHGNCSKVRQKKYWFVSGAPGDEKNVHPGGRKKYFLRT
jgi:ribonuclease I